jgi:hypothetical protein
MDGDTIPMGPVFWKIYGKTMWRGREKRLSSWAQAAPRGRLFSLWADTPGRWRSSTDPATVLSPLRKIFARPGDGLRFK